MDRMTALRVFREVAERGGFAAAGRRLGLSPPAVSKNMAELEAHLGVRLVNRTTRRMALTEEGRSYLERVARALDELDDAERALSPERGEPRGTLRVSAPVSVTLIRLSAEIPRFLERHPRLSLDLDLDERRVDLVGEGFDVAIRGAGQLADSSLIARRLVAMPLVVCASPAYLERAGPLRRPADLAGHDCLRFGAAVRPNEWEFRRGSRLERVTVAGRYAVNSGLALRDALVGGCGIGRLPRLYAGPELATGRLVTVLDDWTTPESTLYAVHPSRLHVAPKVRAFVDFLVETFAMAPR